MAVGGLMCAVVFIGGLIITGAIYHRKAKQRQQSAGKNKIAETYEDQLCESKDQHYDRILSTSTVAGNIIKLK